MARSPGQSDFVVVTARPLELPVAGEPGALGQPEAPGALPTATLRSSEASAFATRWVMGFTWCALLLLVLLCIIGPHIPSGE